MATPAKINDQNLPSVALVGRVNVGKSSLFNKIIGQNKAIVSTIAGTTRTRNIGIANWRGKDFTLVDTGGITFSEEVLLEKEIVEQTKTAIGEADLIIFVVDVQAGLLPQERELAKLLIKDKNKIIFVANKADSEKFRLEAHEAQWRKLGLGEPFPVSAANGSNIGNLLDEVFKRLGKVSVVGKTAKRPKTSKEVKSIKIALIGKPNVGKSSLFNTLIGKDQVIVSDLPHTTREPHDTLVEVDGKSLVFVDTAGIRRKSKVSGELERAGIGKSIDMIKKADVVLFILDAHETITTQDQQLAGFLRENTKSTIIVINKWDLAEENTEEFKNETKAKIYADFPHLDFAPIIFVSAKSQYKVHQIFPLIFRAWEERHTIVPEDELKAFFKKVTKDHRPSRGKGTRHPEVYAFHQIHNNPPMFEMMIKFQTSIHFSYVRYIENKLRERFGFFASPIVIKLTKLRRKINL
ncbi:MAG TPA: ribosome biogenesis GTPase Der [Candidatus Udaeobacter sp.]|nr:ribosome biogenesis GTPase Der [Candidatus Udaeobacter sp.]